VELAKSYFREREFKPLAFHELDGIDLENIARGVYFVYVASYTYDVILRRFAPLSNSLYCQEFDRNMHAKGTIYNGQQPGYLK
jgi:GH18 family chitinase